MFTLYTTMKFFTPYSFTCLYLNRSSFLFSFYHILSLISYNNDTFFSHMYIHTDTCLTETVLSVFRIVPN